MKAEIIGGDDQIVMHRETVNLPQRAMLPPFPGQSHGFGPHLVVAAGSDAAVLLFMAAKKKIVWWSVEITIALSSLGRTSAIRRRK
jgi:hypothetical protein